MFSYFIPCKILKSVYEQVQTVELNKGWNSRLGFSIGLDVCGQFVITAIYNDSVASKDGRLKVGDRVLKVSSLSLLTFCSH